MIFTDWGLIEYEEALSRQRELFQLGIQQRKSGEKLGFKSQVIFCEHPHVYTLGRNAGTENLLASEPKLNSEGIKCIKVERGGNITYHGPGQLVVYPILNLKDFDLYIKDFVWKLEEVIIQTLVEYGIQGERIESAPGVWIDTDKPEKCRKIAALGVRASRFISMHGFALNVNTQMEYFKMINPCGFQADSVTSIKKESRNEISLEDVKEKVRKSFIAQFR